MYFLTLFPSLFPYVFITTLLSFMKTTGKIAKSLSPLTSKVFKVNGGVGYCYLMSLISGCPVGAMLVSNLRLENIISQTEGERGSALCSTYSPSFLITVVGAFCFSSVKLGLFLFLSHLISSFIIGLIFSMYKKDDFPSPFFAISQKKTDNFLYDGIVSSINSVTFVGGIITLFYLFTEILFSLGILNLPIALFAKILGNEEVAKALIFGLFETTKGIKVISSLPPSRQTFLVASFLCGFSGASVILQSLAYLKRAKIKTAPFIFSKIISAVLNLTFSFIFSLLLF